MKGENNAKQSTLLKGSALHVDFRVNLVSTMKGGTYHSINFVLDYKDK